MTIFDIDIPNDYLLRIGRITVAWGILESTVDLALARLGGFRHTGHRSAIITAHMSWPLKMDIMESLVNALIPDHPQLARFPLAKPMLAEAQKARNQIDHGHGVYRDGQVYALRTTARGKLRPSVTPLTLGALDQALNDIARAGRAVLDVVFDASGEPGAVIPDKAP